MPCLGPGRLFGLSSGGTGRGGQFLDLDLVNPPAVHVDNRHPVALVLDDLPALGDALQPGQQKASQGPVVVGLLNTSTPCGWWRTG